ncbi:hypothetical protein Pmar_PMAR010198 [Perkinsus marinus ATCC 50983]|uniref:Uncharacterized protein n=1 Tax=Perkinsus marinus (strain ATCC 50983 / TXsc) TaxID=423536 RepID=C5K534_PERM5|nr:hypothetical protein Pmar_PMAR010198 [Perkinsus marinus ATCC 50983]EER20456.1 hypothetical protein Pmar_PMAR010198 [Perkinsus marinus ATCC 50983]|eukprot:XP_002788660.1 hypothetical protein Pmar_PMAR010198 [Perkinsus marinus ATCC 50983]
MAKHHSPRCGGAGSSPTTTTVLQQLSRLACSNLMQGLLGAISAVDGIRAQLALGPSSPPPREDSASSYEEAEWMINELIFLEQTLADHGSAVSSLNEKVRTLLELAEERQEPSGLPVSSGGVRAGPDVYPTCEKSAHVTKATVSAGGERGGRQAADKPTILTGDEKVAEDEPALSLRLSCSDNSPSSTVIVIDDDEPVVGEAVTASPKSPDSSHGTHSPEEPTRLSKAAKKRRRKRRARQRQRAIMGLVNREKAGEDLSEFEVDVLESFLNDEVPLPPSACLPPELLRMARELCEEWERQQMQQEDKLEEVEYFMMDLANARQEDESVGQRLSEGVHRGCEQQAEPNSTSISSGPPDPGSRPSTSSHLPPEDEVVTAPCDCVRGGRSMFYSVAFGSCRCCMNCSRPRLGCISGGIPVWNEWETLGQVAWKIEDMLEEVVPPTAAKRDRPTGITDARPPRSRRTMSGSGEMKIEITRTLRAVREGVDSLPVRSSASQRLLELRSVMDCLEDSMHSAGENDPSAPPRAVVDMLRATLEKMWPRSSPRLECWQQSPEQSPSQRRRSRRGRTPIKPLDVSGLIAHLNSDEFVI